MAVRYEKDGEIVVSGFENGIQPSPHKGIANIQNANISTETEEVINSFARVQDSTTDTTSTGSLSYLSTDHVNLSIAGSNNLFKGQWIAVTSSSNTGQLPNGTYYVPPSTGAGFELNNYYNVSATTAIATANILTVGGGGGGGGGSANTTAGAGGGAGGFVYQTGQNISNLAAYTITVGSGGAGGAAQAAGTIGNASSMLGTGISITTDGGGAGATTATGGNGASGGGGVATGNAGGTGEAGQGHNGGAGASTGQAGGGGGAGAVGTAASAAGSAGGAGSANSISGASVTYAGGGGSGATSGAGGAGGTGGGGAGSANGTNPPGGNAATANTGGGGGGAGLANAGSNAGGGSGGSGIVIISIPTGIVTSAIGGTHTTSGGRDIWTFTSSGTWTPTLATVSAPTNLLTGFTAGLTATIQLVAPIGKPIASATETYFASGIIYYRYYILDSNGLVWVYDTQNEVTYSSSDNVNWFLPDKNALTKASGIAELSGMVVVATPGGLSGKSVATLGNTNTQATNWVSFPELNGWNGTAESTITPHFCYVGHLGTLYITDGSYIVSVFPDAAIADPGNSTSQNVQSFCSWTGFDAQDGQYSIISGTTPISDDGKRVPAVFFTTGSLPVSLTAGTVYYIVANSSAVGFFNIYTSSTGGTEIQDIQTGAVGNQWFNTFYPLASASASTGATPTYTLTNPAVALPISEVAQCMAEIGTTIIIGCQSSTLYPWNQQATQATSIISLPEANTTNIITVHQMAYVFTGNKGNIYITDGSTASLVSSVPDYCAGVPGTPLTYIEPVFHWGGGGYVRGRVYFSIYDQTATKTGNCGGVWSFVPTQNFYIGQDVGIALRLENQNSYGTYNGYASLIIPRVNQAKSSPQYFSGWVSDINTPLYGIDTTGTVPSTTTIIETDAIPTGTMLDKQTFSQIEFKLATPLLTGDSVTLFYRKNLTDVWKTCGAVRLQGDKLSGYVSANFEKSQWLQLRTLLNSGGSFIRLTELRIR